MSGHCGAEHPRAATVEADRMSPARARPGVDDRVHGGDTIVAELRASGLPLEPRLFEFWFACKSGRNAALTAAAALRGAHRVPGRSHHRTSHPRGLQRGACADA